jgi:uncharacterized protein YciI
MYKVPLDTVDKYLNAHVVYLKDQYKLGNFIASGKKVPRVGGVILSTVKSKEELVRIIEKDPFSINNIADYEIIEFIPTMTNPQLAFLLDDISMTDNQQSK